MLSLPEPAVLALREPILASLTTAECFTSSTAFLIRETTALPNAIHSFLGGDGHMLLGNVLGMEVLGTMMPKSPQELLTTSIADLSLAPDNADAWRTVTITAADHLLPQGCASALDQFLANLDLPKILRLLPAKEDELLPFLSVRCAITPSLPLREGCEAQIFAMARQAAQSDMSDAEVNERVALLTSSLILLSVVPGNEALTHERMHKLFVRMLQAWPTAARILRRRYDGWPTFLPLARQRGFWELEMALRAVV